MRGKIALRKPLLTGCPSRQKVPLLRDFSSQHGVLLCCLSPQLLLCEAFRSRTPVVSPGRSLRSPCGEVNARSLQDNSKTRNALFLLMSGGRSWNPVGPRKPSSPGYSRCCA
ncbi:MAG TPA: hypothetical protein DDY57_11770 [Franconibacter pulveris]|nr:hypothetical protein [Franconibacter pulveris]